MTTEKETFTFDRTIHLGGFSLVPFGSVFAIWAFFGPESFGKWLGTIIHTVKAFI